MRHRAQWAELLAMPAKAADLTIAVGGAFTSMDPPEQTRAMEFSIAP